MASTYVIKSDKLCSLLKSAPMWFSGCNFYFTFCSKIIQEVSCWKITATEPNLENSHISGNMGAHMHIQMRLYFYKKCFSHGSLLHLIGGTSSKNGISFHITEDPTLKTSLVLYLVSLMKGCTRPNSPLVFHAILFF